ncbi:hypothetical protein GCM10017786_48390 [Amycolatopsis deserti]|uniref:Uncharacterized protein n=1 Tax=Amycolatopsis deserti TaxID=185696 RepID=A0ABQ3J7S9_9PSEU|nr:hypothetical protein GCM10017786_48390 [Amycolatopsis deserti]
MVNLHKADGPGISSSRPYQPELLAENLVRIDSRPDPARRATAEHHDTHERISLWPGRCPHWCFACSVNVAGN